MTNRLGIIVICTLLLIGCQTKKTDLKEVLKIRDLNEIAADGKLRVLIAHSATSYFLYRGQTMGYEYELLKRLAKNLNLELDLKVSRNLDEMLDELKSGNVDLVAHGLAVTQERKEEVAFVDYLYLTKQVLVQRKPDNWRDLTIDNIKEAMVQDPIELIGDTVSVRKNSSYFKRLLNLSKEIGGDIVIDPLEGALSTDEIIKQVVDKKIKYTVADGNLAGIHASQYPILDISVPLSFSQRIAWAVRKESPVLLEAINSWIDREKKNPDYYVIYNKYFEYKRSFKRRVNSEFYSLNKNQISAYDRLIKEYARELGWDWRLLASLVYQESQFEPSDSSWAGAKGLMQIMPSTAQELGIKDRADPKESLRGGTAYLEQLASNFEQVRDSVQRIKFAMASYNCGYQHVKDAQSLAEIRGLDKYTWDDNVDKMILALSDPQHYNHKVVQYGYVRGTEPYDYVEQIFDRYKLYASIVE